MQEPETSPVVQPAPVDRGRGRVLSLQNALWLIAVIAVWSSWLIKTRDVSRLKARIAVLQPLARDLVVTDPNQFAAVQREPMWMDDYAWYIHIPPGRFNLCLSTHGIKDEKVPAKAMEKAPLTPGIHEIRLFDQLQTRTGWRVRVLLDGKEILSLDEAKEWNPNVGSQGGSSFSSSQQIPASDTVLLFHRRFSAERTTTNGPLPDTPITNGIVLWVEPTK